jgi:DNA-binding NtrC family response regulator
MSWRELAQNTAKRTEFWSETSWISWQASSRKIQSAAESADVRDQLDGLVTQMVERGILFEEAVGEFEKRFIKRVLERNNGNQSRTAEVLGIHRNTLSRKLTEYKLDHRRGRSR